MLTTYMKNIQSSSVHLEKLIRENEVSFLHWMKNCYGSCDLGGVYFDSWGILYKHMNYSGYDCHSSCTWKQFDEWVLECDILRGD